MSAARRFGGFSGRNVLVTGGTGFIGGALVERLSVSEDADVRVLGHRFGNAVCAARCPVDLVFGDITDPADVRSAVEGRDLVFHCAYGSRGDRSRQRAVNVGGTRNVMEAAREADVDRVVHFSTQMVYGVPSDGDLDESAPRRPLGKAYADTKLEAEELAAGYHARGDLPVTVLQPTAVYGPRGTGWTRYPLETLRDSSVILVDGGRGFANPVYVEDVVDAALAAAVREEALGETFLISGETPEQEPLTWAEFWGRFERMLGVSSTVPMSLSEAERHYRATRERRRPPSLVSELAAQLAGRQARSRYARTREVRAVRSLARRLLPDAIRERAAAGLRGWVERAESAAKNRNGGGSTDPGGERSVPPLEPELARFFAARAHVRIDKARDRLGYRPSWDLDTGMELTRRWAEWAGLLD